MTTFVTAPMVAPERVRKVIGVLADTYHGRGSVELGDPYKVLVATVISARTREEQTTAVSERVFAATPTRSRWPRRTNGSCISCWMAVSTAKSRRRG
jgi:endonuclease III